MPLLRNSERQSLNIWSKNIPGTFLEEFLEDVLGEVPKDIPGKYSDWILWVIPGKNFFAEIPAEIVGYILQKILEETLKENSGKNQKKYHILII